MEKKLKKHGGLIVVTILSFLSLKPLFNSDYFPMHDSLQTERIFEMSQALGDGQFPVRWVKDLGYGYGYPLFNFYGPLPYYFGSLFYLLDFSLVTSAKIMFGLGILLSGISMYYLSKNIWGEWGGVLSAILYQYLPYHAAQIYVRGSVGEYWVYALLPLFVLSIIKLWLHHNLTPPPIHAKSSVSGLHQAFFSGWIIFGGLTYAAIILSHNISGMIVTGLLITFMFSFHLTKYFKNKFNFSLFASHFYIILLGISLSAFFWLPAYVEKDLTKVSEIITGGSYYAEHFINLSQLWNSPWGYGGSAPTGEIDGMSFKLGKIHIFLALVSTALILRYKKKKYYQLLIINYLLLITSILMMLPLSTSIWEHMPTLQFIQFPWRFLMYAGFSLSLLGGGLMISLQSRALWINVFITALIFFMITINLRQLPGKLEIAHFKPSGFYNPIESDFINEINLKWTDSKRSDEYLYRDFIKPERLDDISFSNKFNNRVELSPSANVAQISGLIDKTHKIAYNISSKTTLNHIVNIGYFPGWKAYVNDKEHEINIGDRGFNFRTSSGDHRIMIRFDNTFIRKIGNLISLASIISLSLIIIIKTVKQ